MLIRLLLAAALAAGLSSAAQAQAARVVASCGAQSLRAGDSSALYVDPTGNVCTGTGAASGAASPTGGLTIFRVNSAASTNATSVKSTPGRLYVYTLCNTAGSARYIRFFNVATAPVPGTSTVAAGGIAVAAGRCESFSNDIGLSFTAGIAYDITGAAGDTDATPIAAADVSGFLGYQ